MKARFQFPNTRKAWRQVGYRKNQTKTDRRQTQNYRRDV